VAIKGGPEIKQFRGVVLADLKNGMQNASSKLKKTATTAALDLAQAQVMGDMHMRLGQSKEAREAYERGHKAAKRKAEQEPDNDRARANLGVMEQRLGDLALQLRGDARTALEHYQAARKLREDILLRPRGKQYSQLDMKRLISHDDIHVGEALLALGRPAEARKYLTESLRYREEWVKADPKSGEALSFVTEARMWLGDAFWRLNEGKRAEEHFTRALAICQDLLKKDKESNLLMTDLAEMSGMYGDALFRLGRVDEAEQRYLESLQALRQAMAGNPDDISRQPLLALTHERLGLAADRLKKQAEAKKHHKEAQQLRLELWQVDPGNLSRQTALVVGLARAGDHGQAVRLATTIWPRMKQSTELMLRLARVYAICAALNPAGKAKLVTQALEALAAATRDDYRDHVALATDPDLEVLRSESAFAALLTRIRGK
jgi:tetratricopeptide (TPR) repeat protein